MTQFYGRLFGLIQMFPWHFAMWRARRKVPLLRQHIAVSSPSRIRKKSEKWEQRERISKALEGNIISKDIPVTTITKSQGSEWDYVILSLVRSLNKDELEPNPSLHWLREHLGFLTDEHQINVGLTRARKGLCIIGNRNLLVLHPLWQKLVESYERRKCMVDESTRPRSWSNINSITHCW